MARNAATTGLVEDVLAGNYGASTDAARMFTGKGKCDKRRLG